MKDNYGYSALNPIQLACSSHVEAYLDQIITLDGDSIEVEHVCSRKGPNHKELIDVYHASVNKEIIIFYVYPHAKSSLRKVPKGFIAEAEYRKNAEASGYQFISTLEELPF